jgi:hypothetical protein
MTKEVKPLELTIAQAQAVAPLIARVERLTRLTPASVDEAKDVLRDVLTRHVRTGRLGADPEMVKALATEIAWTLALDHVYEEIDDLRVLSGHPRHVSKIKDEENA